MLQHGKRPTIASRHGMVAAAHPLAAAAGARILSNGGNAFDAAVATAAALNVVEPYMSGLAGRGVATCYIAKEKRVRSLDFVGQISKNFPIDKLSNRSQLQRGAVAVGAPGNLAGWCELNKAHGKKKLPELFAPAIAIARDGFQLIEFNLEEIQGVAGELAGYKALHPEWSRVYTAGAGTVKPGFVLKQPDLARTLEALAAEGPGLLADMGVGRDPQAVPEWTGGMVHGRIATEPQHGSLIGQLAGNAPPPRPMLIATEAAPGLSPSAPPSIEDVPNNHLAYAVQWFLFAGIAGIIYWLALKRRRRTQTP